MKELLAAVNRGNTVAALIFLVLGLFLIIFPEVSSSVLCYLVFAALLLDGLRHVICYFRGQPSEALAGYDLALGACEILLSLFVLIRSNVMLSLLPICLGAALVVSGVIRLQRAFDLHRAGFPAWRTVLILGAVVALLGLLMLINPFATSKLLLIFLGVAMVINAVCLLWTAWCVRQLDS